MAAQAALRGEWCNEDLVFRFSGTDALTICSCNDEGVVEQNFKYAVDKSTLVCKATDASGATRRFRMGAAVQGQLHLVDEADANGAVIELHQTYEDDGEEGLAADTSGTDLGMDLCIVGKKVTK